MNLFFGVQKSRGFIMLSARKTIVTDISYRPCPVLTQNFGNSAARVLQQLHYWLSKENLSYGIIHDNRQWIRNSYYQWQQQIKETQILSLVTIRRAFYLLECKNIILSKQFKQNKSYQGGDQVKSYTIDYDHLESCVGDLTKTLITRPRSIIEQQSTQKKRAGDIAIFNTKNDEQFRNRSPEDGQMSTPPDQMSTPPYNVYISNKLSNKPSHLGQGHSTNSIQHEAEFENKKEEREKNNISLKMIEIWNDVIEQFPGKISLTQERSQTLSFVFAHFFQQELESWTSFCQKIASSKFLMGEVSLFRAHIDWVLKSSTIQRILEDGYSFGDRIPPQKQDTSEGEGGMQLIQTQSLPHLETKEVLKIRELLKQKLMRKYGDDVNYNAWFTDTVISIEENEEEVLRTLFVKTRFVQDTILTRFGDICETLFDVIQFGLPNTNQQLHNTSAQISSEDAQMHIEDIDSEENKDALYSEEKDELCEFSNEDKNCQSNKLDLPHSDVFKETMTSLKEENIPELNLTIDSCNIEYQYPEKNKIEQNIELVKSSYTVETRETQQQENDDISYSFTKEEPNPQNDEKNAQIPKKSMSNILHDIKILQVHKKLKQHIPLEVYEEKFKEADIRICEGKEIFVISARARHDEVYDIYYDIIKSIFEDIVHEEENITQCQTNYSDAYISLEQKERQDTFVHTFFSHQEPLRNIVNNEQTNAIEKRDKKFYNKHDSSGETIKTTFHSDFKNLKHYTNINKEQSHIKIKWIKLWKNQDYIDSLKALARKKGGGFETRELNYTERILLLIDGWKLCANNNKPKIDKCADVDYRPLIRSYICSQTTDPPNTNKRVLSSYSIMPPIN